MSVIHDRVEDPRTVDPFSQLAAAVVRVFAAQYPGLPVALVQVVEVCTLRAWQEIDDGFGDLLVSAESRISAGYHHAEEFS